MQPLVRLSQDVLARQDVQKALADHDFGKVFALFRKWGGISLNKIAEVCDMNASRVGELVRGKGHISTVAKIETIADAFHIPGHMVRLAPRPWESRSTEKSPATMLSGSLPSFDVDGKSLEWSIRETSRRLIELDNDPLAGVSVAEVAVHAFKNVHRRLGSGSCETRYERDVQSAAAELAEFAGWTLFDIGNDGAARRFNEKAYFLSHLSGDSSIELLILQNMGMLASWQGRAREELAIANSVLERKKPSPRIEAIFKSRKAQGLAGSGQISEALRSYDDSMSLLEKGEQANDPAWTWWITEAEINRQYGRAMQVAGEWEKGVAFLRRAMKPEAGSRVGYWSIAEVRLLICFLELEAWNDAEEVSRSLMSSYAETTSGRTHNLLQRTVQKWSHVDHVPSRVRDSLHQLSITISEDPYEL